MLERRAAVQFRAEGRTISGVALRYGDIAPSFNERFESGAFADLSDVRLDTQHDRRRILARTGAGLELTDSADALTFRAELPATREADDALELVRRRILRGASVEFLARQERRDGNTRVVTAAELVAVSIVDDPAFKQSTIETRRARGGLFGGYKYGRLHLTSASGRVRKTRLKSGALDFSIDEGRELTVNLGSSLNSTLATRSSGTLEVAKSAEGVSASIRRLPATQAASDLVALQDAGIALHLRPRYQVPDSLPSGKAAFVDVPEPGNESVLIREVSEAVLLGFDLTVRGGDNGFEPITLTPGPGRKRWYV